MMMMLMMMMMMMTMMMMMLMRNQGFQIQRIFQKRKQLGGYRHLIPLQNVPTLLQILQGS